MAEANIKEVCEIFYKNLKPINDNYLIKFNIYCLINDEKIDEAQILYDLKKELGTVNDVYFENKINLIGYTSKNDKSISEKSISYFI